MKTRNSYKARKLERRREYLARFLEGVRINNPRKPGWNRAEDLGLKPEILPDPMGE